MRVLSRLGCVVVTSWTLAAQSLAAQNEAVPRELVEAVLRRTAPFVGASPELVVGKLPGGFIPQLTLKAPHRILGALVVGRSETVFIASTLPPDSVFVDVGTQLKALGWIAPPPPRGFQPAVAAVPTLFCRDDIVFTMRSVPRSGGGNDIILTRSIGVSDPCQSANGVRAGFDNRLIREMPGLINPPENGPREMCYTTPPDRSIGSAATSTDVRTTFTPGAIVEHYGKQLESAGWTPATPLPSPAAKTWSRPDSASRTREVRIDVTPNPRVPGCYSIRMVLSETRSR